MGTPYQTASRAPCIPKCVKKRRVLGCARISCCGSHARVSRFGGAFCGRTGNLAMTRCGNLPIAAIRLGVETWLNDVHKIKGFYTK